MEKNLSAYEKITSLAEKNQQRAWEIINELKIVEIWEKYGAKANLIGSLYTGLLMKNKDIDFHIYSGHFTIEDSFKAMAEIAGNIRIKRITYDNLIDTEEMCLEWHAWYEDQDKQLWQLDMIHILNESPYAGKIEEVTQRIAEVMTPEMKLNILTIKYDAPENEKIMGIEVYRAVIQDGIKNYSEFKEWEKYHKPLSPLDWIP